MSIIGSLLGWTGMPQWALELIAVGAIAAGAVGAFWIYHHHVYVEGIRAQQVADQKASAKVVAAARAQTRAAEATAAAAHNAYTSEVIRESTLAAQQPLPAVRLCLNSNDSGAGLSQAGAPTGGVAGAGATSGDLQNLPAGNSALRGRPGPDIAHLLELLAERADQVSAVDREWQARLVH